MADPKWLKEDKAKVTDYIRIIAQTKETYGVELSLKSFMDPLQRAHAHIDELRKIIIKGLRTHYYCEDSWYSCPKAHGGCCDESRGDACTCGVDQWNERVLEYLNRQEPPEVK